jgi:threonine dehydratase
VQQVRELCSGSDLDAIIVPVGGGGLLAGIAVAARALCPGIRIIGAEPSAADDAWRSKQAGRLLEHDTLPDTLADGLRTVLGSKTWPIVRDQVSCYSALRTASVGRTHVVVALTVYASAATLHWHTTAISARTSLSTSVFCGACSCLV